jgi:putative hemolysin
VDGGDLWLEISLVIGFILISGLFAAAEIALVSRRDSQIQQLSTRGRRGHVLAGLAKNPTRYLATIQVGITFTSFVSAGLGASQLVPFVEPWLASFGLGKAAALTVAFILVTLVVAFISLVLGELVPKRIAIARAESLAMLFAIPIDVLAKATKPFIWLLTSSTAVVLRIFGVDPHASREQMSGEELRDIVASHEELSADERELIDEVFEAQDRELREVMQPRTEVDFLEGDLPVFKAMKLVVDKPHSRYPVIGESPDDVLGFVHIRDILNPAMSERSIRLSEIAREIPRYPGTKGVIPTLSDMRRNRVHFALVEDEYGGTAGIVTLEDLVEELIGDISDEYDVHEHEEFTGEVIIDGGMNLEDFHEEMEVELPDGPYETVAGFVVAEAGALPEVGLQVEFEGYLFTILEVENKRATKLKLERLSSLNHEALAE